MRPLFRQLLVRGVLGYTLLAGTAAQADWLLPAGASAQLGGGIVSMGCTSLLEGGVVEMGAGSQLVALRNVMVQAGAQLHVADGQVELAQQWHDEGEVTVSSGQVLRMASEGCPLVGPPGRIATDGTAPSPASPVPVPVNGYGGLGLLVFALAWLGWCGQRRTGKGGEISRAGRSSCFLPFF